VQFLFHNPIAETNATLPYCLSRRLSPEVFFFRSRTGNYEEDGFGISVAYSNLINSFGFNLKLLASLLL
jgi:hypothetical protein